MPKYCPSCGADVKEGFKFCLSCGAQLQSDVTAGPSTFEEQAAQTSPTGAVAPVPPPQQPMAQQSTGQTQGYTPMMQPRRSNKNLIIALIAVVAVVIIIAVVVFIFLGGGSDSRFVGTWNVSSGDSSIPIGATWTFEGNGDLKMAYMDQNIKIGTWSVQGDTICLESTYFSGKQCVSYTLSNGGDTLTLHDPSGYGKDLVLTR